ncbi:class I SAM-dependent methyltransferase [Litorihabitans aurantiacus]|nr:class I SAM-dependent methyltransferase [Litorihabitans aurantiacus]
MSFDDPRLVDLYDLDNPDGPDHDHYRALADEIDARRILDLGCGTGMLTVSFARPGREVIGVDPSTAMLAVARRRPGGERVTWVEGDSRVLADPIGTRHTAGSAQPGGSDRPGGPAQPGGPVRPADYAVMTGNVAQHITDPAWERTLADLRGAVRDGATLAFESRNPARHAWEAWAAQPPSTRATSHGDLREWMTTTVLEEGAAGTRIRLDAHNVFEVGGEHVVESGELVFRDVALLERQLAGAGFAVEEVRGDFVGGSFDAASSPLIVVRARAV